MRIQITSTDGIVINSTKEWGELAPPMNPELHWQDYHSAKELAKSVFDNKTLAPKISSVLERFNIPVPENIKGIPEKQLTYYGEEAVTESMIYFFLMQTLTL